MEPNPCAFTRQAIRGRLSSCWFTCGRRRAITPWCTSRPSWASIPPSSRPPTPTPAPEPFGILWLPDTQALAYSHPEKLEALGKEIVSRRESENLIAVIHTGDIVDNGYKDAQWDNFDLCLNAFKDDLPFYPVAGNHDLGVKLLKYDAYLKRPFLSALPAEQTYGGGKMYYIRIERDGVEVLFLFVGWECGKTAEERAWLDGVFEQFPETPCILVTHAYLKDEGTLHSKGAHLEKYVVSAHPNVKLVLCGHRRDAVTTVFDYDDDDDGTNDRAVPALMLNRQSGAYQYRVLRFDPLARTVEVRTFSLGKPELIETDGKLALSFTLTGIF